MAKKVKTAPKSRVALPVDGGGDDAEILVCNSCDSPLDKEGYCSNSACGGVTDKVTGDVVTRAEHDAVAADVREMRKLITSAVGAPEDAPLAAVAARIRADLSMLGKMLGLAPSVPAPVAPASKGSGK